MYKYTYYIYCFYYEEIPFYVGASINPANRLITLRRGTGSLTLGKFLEKIDRTKIRIGILDKAYAVKPKLCFRISMLEQYWINRFLIEGAPLKNEVIKRTSLIRKHYYKNLIQIQNVKRKKISTKNNGQ